MRIVATLLSLAALPTLLSAVEPASAQTAGARMERAGAATEFSAQRRRHRPPTRIFVHPRYNPDDVYPRYYPGPNAVRDCTAHLVQEFRPSGTVITPRVDCFWRPG